MNGDLIFSKNLLISIRIFIYSEKWVSAARDKFWPSLVSVLRHVYYCLVETSQCWYMKYERNGGVHIGMDQLVGHLSHGLLVGIKRWDGSWWILTSWKRPIGSCKKLFIMFAWSNIPRFQTGGHTSVFLNEWCCYQEPAWLRCRVTAVVRDLGSSVIRIENIGWGHCMPPRWLFSGRYTRSVMILMPRAYDWHWMAKEWLDRCSNVNFNLKW